MAWIARGLRNGVLTTAYPRRRDDYADEFAGGVAVRRPQDPDRSLSKDSDQQRRPLPPCPTGAIGRDRDGFPWIDRGRCILCGRCTDDQPDRFVWQRGSEVAVASRRELLSDFPESAPPTELDDVDAIRRALAQRTRRFRRSLMIRHVDLGSDGSEEWEIAALVNPVYDIHRLGLYFTTSPRHADLLMITGAGSRAMRESLRRTVEATSRPYVVMAVGTDAISGGMITPAVEVTRGKPHAIDPVPTYAASGGIASGGIAPGVPADVLVPGSPPSPFMILSGLLLATNRLTRQQPRPSGGRS